MKTLQNSFLLLALLLSVSLTSCDVFDDICISPVDDAVTETLDLADFDAIHLKVAADVVLTEGPIQTVTVEGSQNIIDLLDLSVNNGEWTIRFTSCVKDNDDFTIFITIPNLTSVDVSGSGSVQGTTTFHTEDLDLDISGSGDIVLDVKGDVINSKISGSGSLRLDALASKINASISGSGRIFTSGASPRQQVNISGSGNYNGYELDTEDTEVNTSGSGSARVLASDYLDVKISGSGSVSYRGHPQIEQKISGSGRLIDDN